MRILPEYATLPEKGLIVTDSKKFTLDVAEFIAMR